MGIYSRYATAVLVLFTSSAFSATRVPVKPTSETVITGARTGAVSTPSGDVAFYGADKVYSFTAGDSVAPTVREVKSTVGSVSYPYGPGAAYPNDPTYSASSATKIKVKPVAVVPKTNIATGLKKLVKANPAQLLLGAATSAAVSAVGWVMTDGVVVKKRSDDLSPPVSAFSFTMGGCYNQVRNYTRASEFVACMSTAYPQNTYKLVTDYGWNATGTSYSFKWSNNGAVFTADQPSSGSCSAPYVISSGRCIIPGSSVYSPIQDSDLSDLDPFVSSQTASFLGDLLKEVCKASVSPANCYSEMEDRSKRNLQGPATIAGPWFTKTSTFPKPDGTTGTKTETTSTKYDFTYGPEHFDVNPERKTTTTEDGVVTSETTETDGTPAEDVADTPDEETPPEESYTFNDSELPAVEPFYTQKYPDGFQGVWDSANTDFEQSAFVSFLNSFVPSFSGSCPAFSMSFAIGNVANFGTHGFGNLCYALDFVKVCIMLGALFLCRAIVFGG